MISSLLFEPPFPMPVIVGLGMVLAVLTIVCYARMRGGVPWIKRAVLAALRLTAITGLIVVLLRPMQMQPQPVEIQKPVFSVLIDVSGSMNTVDVGTNTRLQAVMDQLQADERTIDRLRERYDVKFYEFSDAIQPVSFGQLIERNVATGTKTDLAAALFGVGGADGLRARAGALLVSDGRDNAGGAIDQAAAYLKSLKEPVWTTAVGAATETKDVSLVARLSQNFMFVKQPATIQVDISQSGYDNWYAKVNVYREDQPVTTREIILKSGSTRLEIPIHEDHKGVFKYVAEVEPLPGEADRENNRRAVFTRVVDEKPHVLLVEAEPYWDSKFLQRTLRADPNLEVTSIFQLNEHKVFTIKERTSADTLEKEVSDGKGPTQIVNFPRTSEELAQYDCLIFGHGVDEALTPAQIKLLKDYLVDRGGSIVFSRGRAYSAENSELAGIEPVIWDRDQIPDARFELTAEGKMNPIFSFGHPQPTDAIIRELPPMVSITRIQKGKSLAVILAKAKNENRHEEVAVIAYQRYGKGKVMTIGSSGLWRWAFMPEDLKEYDDVYKLFWGQMIRWLIDESDFLPGQDISFHTDRYTYNLGDKIRFIIRMKQIEPATYHPLIRLSGPGVKTATLTPAADPDSPTVLTAYYTPEQEGEFEAVLQNNVGQPQEDTARFTAYSDSTENRFVAVDHESLARISRVTGGEELTLAQWKTLPDKVNCFELLSRDKVKPKDAWDTLPIYFALIGALALEWLLRRRWGLV